MDKDGNVDKEKNSQPGNAETSQAYTGSEVREGQENSSILHEKDLEKVYPEFPGTDKSSTSQEEYVDDDLNTIKDEDE